MNFNKKTLMTKKLILELNCEYTQVMLVERERENIALINTEPMVW